MNAKEIVSEDNNFIVESDGGFASEESFTYEVISDKEEAMQDIKDSKIEVDGEFVSAYEFNLESKQDITIKFNPNVENVNNLQVYKLEDEKLVLVEYTTLENGMISINCSSTDKLYLFEVSNKENDSDETNTKDNTMVITIAIVLGIVAVGVVVLVVLKKVRGSNNVKNTNDNEQGTTQGKRFIKVNKKNKKQNNDKNSY